MKKLLLCFLFIGASVNAQTIRLSDPVATDGQYETFGQSLNSNLPQMSLNELLTDSETHTGKPFLLKTKIAKVCQKKGCFFIAQEDDKVMRISFKDYGFFIPTNSSNKEVVLTGQLIAKERSAEQAEHFNQDLGNDQGTLAAGKVYEIVAQSIKIPIS